MGRYKAFVRRATAATDDEDAALLWHSRASSLAIVVAGLVAAIWVSDINTVWSWLTMSLGGGMIGSYFLRWYWWRLTGYGYTAGLLGGALSGVYFRVSGSLPEAATFACTAASGVVVAVAVTMCCDAPEPSSLLEFYGRTRPPGAWGPVRQLTGEICRALIRHTQSTIFIYFVT